MNFNGTRIDEDLHVVHANEPNGMWHARGVVRITGEHTILVRYIHLPRGPWWICMHIHVYLDVLNRNFEHCTAR